jgi:hypothetical protein
MGLPTREISKFIRLIFNINSEFIAVFMKGLTIFGSITLIYFQDHMMDRVPYLSLSRWYF